MKILLYVATLCVLASARTRIRRQNTGCFWWEDPNCDLGIEGSAAANDAVAEVPTEAPPPPAEETRSNTNVDADRIANENNPGRVNPAADGTDYAPCNGNQGVCVPYYLCNEGNVITDGAGLIDPRFGGTCPNFLDICCKKPETEPVDIIDPVVPNQCGVRNVEGIGLRVLTLGEGQAQYAEYPWMAAILRKELLEDKEINLYVCGGSLIHPQVVLTAAHCVYTKDAASLKVRLGEWDTQRTYERHPHVDSDVRAVVIHEGFNSGALWNDFALLFLTNPVQLAPNIATICLPPQGQSFDYNTCVATGWGRDEFGKEGNYQNVLKEVDLPVVPKTDCENALRTTRLGKFFRLDQSFMCAGGQPGVDTCKGDGGSPLVCEISPNSNIYVQAGIVAWGIGCGENNIPGVYADVAVGSDWIIQKSNEGLAAVGVDSTQYWRNYS